MNENKITHGPEEKPDELIGLTISGQLLITDSDTGEVLVNQRAEE